MRKERIDHAVAIDPSPTAWLKVRFGETLKPTRETRALPGGKFNWSDFSREWNERIPAAG